MMVDSDCQFIVPEFMAVLERVCWCTRC
ncbi:hypothetical protein DFAR_1890010 [Desulfarculales bacterium]